MKGVDSHGCCKNYCENRITASAYMPDNDTTGGYVLHMAVGNGISYPVGDHLHYSLLCFLAGQWCGWKQSKSD